MIRLFTTIYNEQNNLRKKELFQSIFKNVQVNAICEIYLLNESVEIDELNHPKIRLIDIAQRPTYSDFFNLINKIANKNDISIIANTDIYFDNHIRVLEHLLTSEKCFALSRWETNEPKPRLFNRNDSQDTWIFRGKIKDKVIGDFCLGVTRCDNRILFELQQAGYIVSNPAFNIRSFHLHAGVRPEYNELNTGHFVPPPYKYLFPGNEGNLLSNLFFNVTHTYKLAAYHYDRKKINRWIIYRLLRKLMLLFFKYEMPLIGYPKL